MARSESFHISVLDCCCCSLKVHLHTTTVSMVVGCSVVSLVLILRDKARKRRVEDNHNHD